MPRPLPAVDEVAPGLWVGPCPSSPELIQRLNRELSITGLVSVQTDGDIKSLGLTWKLLWRFLLTNNINVARVPIEDFNDKALTAGLSEAVDAVNNLMNAGHITYLHCTAGVNRSPTVAIAWLVRDKGMTLDDAWRQVVSRRQSAPNRPVLDRWVETLD